MVGLEAVVEPVLRAALADTGWQIDAIRRGPAIGSARPDFSFALRSGECGTELIVEARNAPRPGQLRETASFIARQVAESAASGAGFAIMAPRITPALEDLLRELGVGYMDLQGKVLLKCRGLYVERPGGEPLALPESAEVRPSALAGGGELTAESVFGLGSPKRHRVLRAILSYPGRDWHQTELAEEAAVSPYTAHTVVSHLVGEHYADEEGAGPRKTVRLVRPETLLQTWSLYWRSVWRRQMTAASQYYSLAAGPDEIASELAAAASELGQGLAFTLATGAEAYGAYLRSEQVHAYVASAPDVLAEASDLEPVETGNVVLMRAFDEGVFYRPAGVQTEPVVGAVQLYLDMTAAGGRYAEQAGDLIREEFGYEI